MENLNKYCVQYTKQKLLSATLIRSLIGFKVTCRRSHKEKFLHQNVERVHSRNSFLVIDERHVEYKASQNE